MSAKIEFKNLIQGNWHILQAIGRIDATNAAAAQTAASAAMDNTNQLALDMSHLEYISSAGLRVLLSLGKKAKKDAKKFVLCGVIGMVKEILEDSGTDMLFEVYNSAADLK